MHMAVCQTESCLVVLPLLVLHFVHPSMRLQIVLLYNSVGPFAAPNEVCPFRCMPMTDEEIDAFDEHLASLLRRLDCDACSSIYLPKQLQLDDGAEDLLMWFKETTGLFGVREQPQKDLQRASASLMRFTETPTADCILFEVAKFLRSL